MDERSKSRIKEAQYGTCAIKQTLGWEPFTSYNTKIQRIMDRASIIAIEEVCKRCPIYTKYCGMSEYPSQCLHSGHFIDGYRKAEKDTIERAVNVLVNLPSLVIPSNYIAYFREKMMEE